MTGEVFGYLTVIRQEGENTGVRTRWACACECGRTTVVRGDHLRSGATRSCGCLRRQQRFTLHLEGMTFGLLTVVRRETNAPGLESRWYCICECGGTTVVRGTGLKDGTTRSCGCLRSVDHPLACTNCGNQADAYVFGWCPACYRRWDRAGRPNNGPPAPRVTSTEAWRALPARPFPGTGEVTDLSAGTAAEHLVCADLLLQGYRAFMSDQNCPYDVAVDLGRLIRIQVKATRKPREIPGRKTPLQAYLFRLGRSRPAGTKAYAEGEFEMLALVALDARLIAYFPANLHVGSLCIGQPGARTGKKFADYPFAKTAAELGLAAQEGV